MRSSSSSLHIIICSLPPFTPQNIFSLTYSDTFSYGCWVILLSNTHFMSSQWLIETLHKMASPYPPTMSNAISPSCDKKCVFAFLKFQIFDCHFRQKVRMTILQAHSHLHLGELSRWNLSSISDWFYGQLQQFHWLRNSKLGCPYRELICQSILETFSD